MTGANIILSGSIGTSAGTSILGSSSVIFASDANHTLSSSEQTGQFLAVTSSVSLTTTRNLIAPLDVGRFYTVKNSTTGGQSIQIIGSSGTGVTITNGSTLLVETDGINYFTPAGITQLTGDVHAGPGTGSQVTTLATVNSNVGTFGSTTAIPSITVNAKGLITAVTTGTATVSAVSGITVSGTPSSNQVLTATSSSTANWQTPTAGGITQLTGDGTAGPGSGSQSLTLTTVNGNVGTFGSATAIPSFTVNAKGLITAVTTTIPTVSAVSGITVSGTPSSGQVLTATSSSAANWQTPSSSGVTWANDLAGSSNTNQYVASLSGSGGSGSAISINSTALSFSSTQTSPLINQVAIASTSGGAGTAGQTLFVTAQAGQATTAPFAGGGNGGSLVVSAGAGGTSSSFTAGVGGDLTLTSGSGSTVGNVHVQTGGTDRLIISPSTLSINSTTSVNLTPPGLQWNSAVSNPKLTQITNTANSAFGQTLAIQAQNCTGTSSFGGAVTISSGAGTVNSGTVSVQIAGSDIIVASNGSVAVGPDTSGPAPIVMSWPTFLTTDSSPHVVETISLPSSPAVKTIEIDWIARSTVSPFNNSVGKNIASFFNNSGTATTLGINIPANGLVYQAGQSSVTVTFNPSGGGVQIIANGTTDNTEWTFVVRETNNLA